MKRKILEILTAQICILAITLIPEKFHVERGQLLHTLYSILGGVIGYSFLLLGMNAKSKLSFVKSARTNKEEVAIRKPFFDKVEITFVLLFIVTSSIIMSALSRDEWTHTLLIVLLKQQDWRLLSINLAQIFFVSSLYSLLIVFPVIARLMHIESRWTGFLFIIVCIVVALSSLFKIWIPLIFSGILLISDELIIKANESKS